MDEMNSSGHPQSVFWKTGRMKCLIEKRSREGLLQL